MKKIRLLVSVILTLLTVIINAQTTKEELLSDLRFVGGLYCPYIYVNTSPTPAPEGYIPFYISHYGRHGSRWLNNPNWHTLTKDILSKADNAGKLTTLGKSLYERIKIAAEDGIDRYGDLAPLGVKEQKEIAERMYRNYPEIFSTKDGRKCFIYSRSTQVPRCILSMAANNERLKELNPEIEIVRDASLKFHYLNNEAKINKDTVKAINTDFMIKNLHPSRFIASIFTDTLFVKQLVKDTRYLLYLVFQTASNLANIDYLHLSMYDVFTDDEIFVLWQASNLQMYLEVGPSAVNGKAALKSAGLLLKDILDCADSAIKNMNISADLRFGHDTYITPLLALMDIKNMNIVEADPNKIYKAWSNFKASPMASNLQLVFYRNDKTGDILVKPLLCEKEISIPVATDMAPFYHWRDFRAYYEKKIIE